MVINISKIRTMKELYKKVTPALNAKEEILHVQNFQIIKADDIWNYLLFNKWMNNKSKLELSDIVSDIMNVDGYLVSKYVLENMSLKDREVYFGN